MTGLEVTDTAIKIGLGAALTGIFALWAARGSRRHELQCEVQKRKQDILEKVTDDFETVHVEIVQLALNLHTFETLKHVPQFAEDLRKKISSHFENLNHSAIVLQKAEGKLLLVGITSGAATLARYRKTLTEFLAACGTPAERTKEKILERILPLNDLHLEFYGWVTNDFCAMPEKGFAKGYLPKSK